MNNFTILGFDNFPVAGMDVYFITTDGKYHHGKYDIIKTRSLKCVRRWIDDDGKIFDSSKVTSWKEDVSKK